MIKLYEVMRSLMFMIKDYFYFLMDK